MQRSLAGGCEGPLAEALVEGKVIRVPKHSSVIEFYGAVEEAELYLARSRLGLQRRGLEREAEAARELQEATRLLILALSGHVDPEAVAARAERAAATLPRAGGWLLAGCGGEAEVDLGLAAAKLRAAERHASRMAEEGVITGARMVALSRAINSIVDAVYRLRWLLCGGRSWRPPRAAAAAGARAKGR